MLNPSLPQKHSGFYPEKTRTFQPFPKKSLSTTLTYAHKNLFRRYKTFADFAEPVRQRENYFSSLESEELRAAADSLRHRLSLDKHTTEIAVDVFALVREQAKRVLGLRHFDVQIIGGWVILNGMIAEMSTGEGKTLTATLPASFAAMAGIPVHIITANDYLAERDADLMRPLYQTLGISVGAIQDSMTQAERKKVYNLDIVYCSNKEIVFDYLKDRLILLNNQAARNNPALHKLYENSPFTEFLRMRGLHFGIVDEADCIFIDEARTPLIISQVGDSGLPPEIYATLLPLAKRLLRNKDFCINKAHKSIELTATGSDKIAAFPKQIPALSIYRPYLDFLGKKALEALYLYNNGQEYIVSEGKVAIVGEQTGRIMHGRSWQMGLQQFIESKEGCEITGQPETLIKINFQNFFNRYHHLAGMTGTAREVQRELWDVYTLHVVQIPTNVKPKRKNLGVKLCRTRDEKERVVVETVKAMYQEKRPVLIGTASVSSSEKLASLLLESGLKCTLLNARQDSHEAEIIAQAGTPGQITVATNMAGRGTDILLAKTVAGRGGLHVLATECANPQRIDRQLFGRCGRQGDPGSFESLFSLDDGLFNQDNMTLMANFLFFSKFRLKISDTYLSKLLINSVQKAVEREYYFMRCRLLEQENIRERGLAFSRSIE